MKSRLALVLLGAALVGTPVAQSAGHLTMIERAEGGPTPVKITPAVARAQAAAQATLARLSKSVSLGIQTHHR